MFNLEKLFPGRPPDEAMQKRLCIHMDDSLAVYRLSSYLSTSLAETAKKGHPLLMCIGTDRSTGDSLGPLSGWLLTSLLHDWEIPIYGTLERPLHAMNLVSTMQTIQPAISDSPVIAVDACLGQVSPVGSILAVQEPLKPGIGLKKDLPKIGDISITGIVNVGGALEFQILQNTRLNLVLKMASIIANSIFLAVQKNYPQLRKAACHK